MQAYGLLLGSAEKAMQRCAPANKGQPLHFEPEEEVTRVAVERLPLGYYQNPTKDSLYMGYVPPPPMGSENV